MTLESLEFEVPRRVVLFKAATEMPDQSLLGYTGDPNDAVNGNTDGETLLWFCPAGSHFLDTGVEPNEEWVKVTPPIGGGVGGGLWVQITFGGGEGVTAPTKVAGADVGGHRIVTVDANDQIIHADPTNLIHSKKIVGLTLQAASSGNSSELALDGDEVTEGSWSWDTDLPIFFTTDGVLTQTIPTTDYVIIVAFPLSSDKIKLRITNPITLV